jgi:ATP synthase protein I
MNEELKTKPVSGETEFSQQVGEKAARKLKAQRHVNQTVWSGLGMMGLVGWSVVVPTLLGAALGLWLDKNYPGSHSWTLMLLAIGLGLGCFNAWHWVAKEGREIHEQEGDNHD